MSSDVQDKTLVVPVLLLKTKSTPGDSYEETFLKAPVSDSFTFQPEFVPVLQHTFLDDGLAEVAALLRGRKIGAGPDCSYGGLIFTSQRAVEAFAQVVGDGPGMSPRNQIASLPQLTRRLPGPTSDAALAAGWPHLDDIPVYSVGPATTRALSSVPVPATSPLQVFGAHTGNGEALAAFILSHYHLWYADRQPKPLLFLVGETRRDVIPRTLQGQADERLRLGVTEVEVYGTREMLGFAGELRGMLERTGAARVRWAVVFSPTGCDGLLREMGVLDAETGKAKVAAAEVPEADAVFVATIGPTTRDFLRSRFGFEPQVCAESPTPEALCRGVLEFMREKGLLRAS